MQHHAATGSRSLPLGTGHVPSVAALPAGDDVSALHAAPPTRADRPPPLTARPPASVLSMFMVPEGTVSSPPVLRFVGSSHKRADARRRATARATRSEPMTPPAKSGSNAGGATTITTHVRVRARGKRARAAAPPLPAGAPPVLDYESPIHMFTLWYEHGDHGRDQSKSAHDAWHTMPTGHSNKREKWCRAYWERAYAREARDAYAKRSHFIVDADGRRVRIDMPAPHVTVTPTVEELAMTFYSDTRGDVVDPRDVVYGLWDQDLLDRWFHRSTRWCAPDADPALDAIVRRRWVMGNHARYLCAWARPDVGVNARRLVRPRGVARDSTAPVTDAAPLDAAGEDKAACATPIIMRSAEQRTTWHAAVTLCQNARYAAAIKTYEERLRERAAAAVSAFLDRMRVAGHGELIGMLEIEARIALYALGILNERTDGPRPKSPCVFGPGYCMTTRERLMSVVPPPPVRGPTTQPVARDPDARRAFEAIMGLNAKAGGDDALNAVPSTPDPLDEVRSQRRVAVDRGVRVKRLIRREWNRVERRDLLGDVEVDQDQEDDESDEDTDDAENAGEAGGGRSRRPKPDPFWSGIERRMRLLDLVDD
ncbi:hypothetical protein psal_cds_280 [Pandoravirus salinus]|uniref:Uncharacterized protein n=1 Tax=Pandoravirus salinus TaxID=1349410 RepID=A0A291ATF5_9VIRU|nr:hypothetical protein psal_cds_280 [Pandoravirus salinus]ATE82153.1 hypothetical protein psal_cds_280 [Pandoravirus salinus]